MTVSRIRMSRRAGALLSLLAAGSLIAGCGSSGGAGSSGESASTLVSQTFSSANTVQSGNLHFGLTITPSGSTSVKGPISLTFGGPFQSMGKGKLPASDFTASISGFGRSGSLSLISTGNAGFVTLSGTSYQLPAATFQKLESGFASAGSGGGLGSLGIDARGWLTHPAVVGHETIDGTDTTHVSAGVDVGKLLDGVTALVKKAGQLGVSGAGSIPSISPQERAKIAAAIQHPRVDLWTGSSDHMLRKLQVTLSVPVTGQISALLGGLKSASFLLTLGYSSVNQHQTISAPASSRPYKELQQRLGSLLSGLQGAAGGLGLGTGSAGGSPSGAAGGASSASISAYAQCIQSAGGDPAKMQRCAGLLNVK